MNGLATDVYNMNFTMLGTKTIIKTIDAHHIFASFGILFILLIL